MTYTRTVKVPILSRMSVVPNGTTALAHRIDYRTATFTFADLAVIPRSVFHTKMDKASLMWAALKWGLSSGQFDVLDEMPMFAIREQVSWWERQSGITLAEIAAVRRTIEVHPSEAEFDIIQMGMRLRDFPDERHTWRDLMVIIKHLDPNARLYRACHPESAGWDLNNQLLAWAVDVLRWLQWAQTEDSQNPDSAPDPIPRPGVKAATRTAVEKALKPGRGMTIERAKEVFDRPNRDVGREARLYQLFRGKA